jgi:hypothetical protein
MKENDNKEFMKRAEEIIETISCWNGVEDEVLKLFCLFTQCKTVKFNGAELVNINYVREKIFNIILKNPIILSSDAARMFCQMKIEKDQHEKKDIE